MNINIGSAFPKFSSGVNQLVNDDVLFRLGTDGDQVFLNRSTTLNANTALTSVLIGTPVAQALAANSLIISNVTASGDIAMYGNLGGNSQQFLFHDTSATALTLGVASGYSNLLGNIYINDTSNANITIGLTINMGANNYGFFAGKSSGVSHGMTALMETDSFVTFWKLEPNAGGFAFVAAKDANATDCNVFRTISASGVALDTTQSTAGRALNEVTGGIISGTTWGAITANGNLFGVRATTTSAVESTVALINQAGNLWLNGGVTLGSASALTIGTNQVVGARVVDARCDDAVNSGDATTDGVIDALRDAMIAHGLVAAA